MTRRGDQHRTRDGGGAGIGVGVMPERLERAVGRERLGWCALVFSLGHDEMVWSRGRDDLLLLFGGR